MTMDMLTPNKFLLILGLSLFMLSCSNKKVKAKEELREENISKLTESYRIFTIQDIGLEEYNNIYNSANDSIRNWIEHGLKSSKMQKYSSEWILDSVICVNKRKNKSIMVILNKKSNTVSNSLNYLYGVKIDKAWHFFYGPTLYVDSGMNEKVVKSFKQIHEIAMKNVLKNYLKKSPTGEWEINDSFFGDITSGAWHVYGWPKPQTEEDWNKVYVYHVKENWRHRDTTEYLPSQ